MGRPNISLTNASPPLVVPIRRVGDFAPRIDTPSESAHRPVSGMTYMSPDTDVRYLRCSGGDASDERELWLAVG